MRSRWVPRWLIEMVKAATQGAGYDVTRLVEGSSMDAALTRVSERFEVSTVIDVGASDGRWSVKARSRFPSAAYLLIEAQSAAHARALERYARHHRNTSVVLAAAGDRIGTISFDASDPFGGAAHGGQSQASIEVPMTTVDAEVERLGLAGPYLLKLDTHGFEREILMGARNTLAGADLLIIEAYNFELRPGVLRFTNSALSSRISGSGQSIS